MRFCKEMNTLERHDDSTGLEPGAGSGGSKMAAAGWGESAAGVGRGPALFVFRIHLNPERPNRCCRCPPPVPGTLRQAAQWSQSDAIWTNFESSFLLQEKNTRNPNCR